MKGIPILLVICASMAASARAQAPDTEGAGAPPDAARTPAPAPPAPVPKPPSPEPPGKGKSDAPAAKPTPAVKPAPVTKPTPATKPTPVTKPTPATKPAPAAKPVAAKPAAKPAPLPQLLSSSEPSREEPAAKPAPPVAPPATVAVPQAAPAPAPSVTQASPPATRENPRAGFFDLRISDVVTALFAAMLVLLMYKLARTTSGLWAAAQAQFGDNRRAVEASERVAEAAARSAEAAVETMTAMRATTDRQTRAYVTAKQFQQGASRDDNQKLLGWLFQVVWQNSGATPTKGLRYWTAIRTFENRIPGDFDYAPPTATSFAGGELGAGSSTASGTVFLPQKEIASMKNGMRKAILYGEAQYSDVFEPDTNRITRFSVELVVIGEANGAHPAPFTFLYHSRYNHLS